LSTGYCLSAGDIIQTALKQESVSSRLVECSLTLSDDNDTWVIGFNDIINPGEIDTHVVVVTETQPPLLIDASISDKIGGIIVDEIPLLATVGQDNILADYYFIERRLKATYIEKPASRWPTLHNTHILNRIIIDKKIEQDIKFLKRLNYIGITLSFFAVVAVINQIFRWFI
jgi:hypothetical protein